MLHITDFFGLAGAQEELESSPKLQNNEQEIISGQNVVPDLGVRKDDFCTEQLKDSIIKIIDGEPIESDLGCLFSTWLLKITSCIK